MSEYSISIQDNDSFMCSSTDRVFDNMYGLKVCEKCHYRTDFEYINDDFKVKLRTYDLSCTYDGYYIASLKFKELVSRESIKDIDFIPLENDQDFFVMFARSIVKFDTVKRKSRSENFCEKCGYYESLVGATPAFLKEPLTNEICRSDIMFGSGNAKHPLLFATENFVALVKREKLNGVRFKATRA